MGDISPTTIETENSTQTASDQSPQSNDASALLSTSSQSRAQYANDVNTMNTAVNNINPSPVASAPNSYTPLRDYLAGSGQSFSMDNLKTLATKYGMNGYIGTDQQNTQLAQMIKSNPNGGSQDTQTQSKPVDIFANSATGAKVTGSVANTDGSMTVNYEDGSSSKFQQNPDGTWKAAADTTGTQPDGNNPTGSDTTLTNNSSLDPETLKAYKDALGNLDSNIAQAKDTLLQAQQTVQNDPAAQSAIQQIMQKYDTQIQIMKDKNAMLLGGYRENAARSGLLQYGNDMYSNFMSAEQDRASQRIADLVNQETSLILKTQQAYKSGDLKELSQATKDYNDANKAKIDAINKLLTATNNHVKVLQAQQKIDQVQQKNQLASDGKTSALIVDKVMKNIKASGVTDPKRINDYITATAQQNNISNPEILKSAYEKAVQSASNLDLKNKNIESQINRRNVENANTESVIAKRASGGGNSGSKSLSKVENNTIGNILENGDTIYGVKYNGRGGDGYVDPNLYSLIYTRLENQSGARAQQFLKSYPPEKYINPANINNSNLPQPILSHLSAKQAKGSSGKVDLQQAKEKFNSKK